MLQRMLTEVFRRPSDQTRRHAVLPVGARESSWAEQPPNVDVLWDQVGETIDFGEAGTKIPSGPAARHRYCYWFDGHNLHRTS
ncbi:MAG: hypothetical protein ACI9N0_000833 [Ilumatobacter sp.]|jgi:hypothetical protein